MWHTLSKKTLSEKLAVDYTVGLSEIEAAARLARVGLNQLPPEKADSLFIIFLRQFYSPLILILACASAILFSLSNSTDGLIILFVLFLNATIGTIQEGRAKHSLAALKKLVTANALVLRNGKEMQISDAHVVPGDIIIIEEGEKIPADARIIESFGLRIDESALTGESGPIDKEDIVLKKETLAIGDRVNMLFKGTYALSGNGVAVVTETGTHTEIGKISASLVRVATEIPLHGEIRILSRFIAKTVIALVVILFAVGVAFGNSISVMFATVVSIAVSVIPEGLPVVMTLVLASGVWRMAKRNALVKKLQAVEALGQTQVIAVDKTGTLTKNEMVVRQVHISNAVYEVTGTGYTPEGVITKDAMPIDQSKEKDLMFLHTIATLSANSRIAYIEKTDQWQLKGDPTEAAMVTLSKKLGSSKEQLEQQYPKKSEIPFTSQTKYRAALVQLPGGARLACAGAAERILALCTSYYEKEKSKKLTKPRSKQILGAIHDSSKQGFRVIGIAYKDVTESQMASALDVRGLIFAGFYCIEDSIRPQARDAIERAKNAGVKIVMMTGDHKLTAQTIGALVGIYQEGDNIITGEEIDSLSSSDLARLLEKTSIFARVSPEHKLKIIQGYKARGDIIAMTGDGVNDAPALVAADLGVSMGKIGTEVAREASDIVLLDDNLDSIVWAIEEGRNMYISIKRVILYLASTNAGEVLTITVALFLGFPLPLVAAQIIWLNLVTDSFLDVALSLEPKRPTLLSSAFHRGRGLFDALMRRRAILMSLTMMIGTLFVYTLYFQHDLLKAQTMAFTALALFQWANALNCRSRNRSIFTLNPLSNPALIIAFGIVALLQLLAIYHPTLNAILHTTPLTFVEWIFVGAIACSVIAVEEVRKIMTQKNGLAPSH